MAVAGVLLGGSALLVLSDDGAPARGSAAGVRRLPEVVNAPGAWSDDEGVPGPLAAVGLADRTRPVGLADRRESLEMFGVSAGDGTSAWIELPGTDVEDLDLADGFALSPDGRWLAWTRRAPGSGLFDGLSLRGWAVMDTTTGRVRELTDPGAPRLRETASELAFSGDSGYLLTSHERPGAPQRRGHRFVAWDVRTGRPTTIEEPGHHWLPSLGSAPSGVVWSRERRVHRQDPATGVRTTSVLPRDVLTASWGPDDRAFAYVGRGERRHAPWLLYAGPSVEEARLRPLPTDVRAGELLGWVDERHVVVGHWRTSVHVVDVVTGAVLERSLRGYGPQLNAPHLAADLWQQPLGPAPAPVATTDPRGPVRWGGGAALAAFGGVVLLRRRRARVDRPGRVEPDPSC